MIWLMDKVSDKVLRYKAFNIAKNPKYYEYERGLTSMVYIFFDENIKSSGIKKEITQNQQISWRITRTTY